jgi:3-dehydroquinate synthase
MIISTLWAKLESSEYPIWIGNDLAKEVPGCIDSFTKSNRVFLLSDAVFKDGYASRLEKDLRVQGFDVTVFYMSGGKAHKTIHSALRILDVLESMEFTRDATFLTLGGGIVGDVGGFVAATYFRGMNLVHIPTTITAQIDSSIGGKVAVNHNETINAIGTYYHPRAILLDMDFVTNLPEREFRSGMGEVVKSAIIRDGLFCSFLLDNQTELAARSPDFLPEMLRRTVRIKLDHVEQDPREKGIRLHLNYGHTIGQAIEISTSLEHEIYRHGEAVALGMLGAARLADLYYGDGLNRVDVHRELLHAYALPLNIDMHSIGMDTASLKRSIYSNLFKDKKRVAGGIRFVLVPKLGLAEVITGIGESEVRSAISSLF